MTSYEYKMFNISETPRAYQSSASPADAANHCAQEGWETVCYIPAPHPEFSAQLLVKRVKQDPVWPEKLAEPEHNHPLGEACGGLCPVLIGTILRNF